MFQLPSELDPLFVTALNERTFRIVFDFNDVVAEVELLENGYTWQACKRLACFDISLCRNMASRCDYSEISNRMKREYRNVEIEEKRS